MGLLVDGAWRTDWYDTEKTGGRFVRDTARFRNWITPDGAPGPSGEGGFPAEAGRYHLYVSLACPWAHRTLLYRALCGLEDVISVSVVSPYMFDDGWTFEENFPGVTGDRLYGERFMRDIYLRADPKASGRVTVPVLWDGKRETIVSNESAEIIRMFDTAFGALTGRRETFRPAARADEIDAANDRIYQTLNNGVYRAGFATTQAAYEEAVFPVFETLDWLEARLARTRYVAGEALTEADLRLFPTLIRFDSVYHGHFKCNLRRIADYPNLSGWLRDLYQTPGVAGTVDLEHAKTHYYASHRGLNPSGIVPSGPVLDLASAHGRDGRRAA
jgi:putative glutathione S-transferase